MNEFRSDDELLALLGDAFPTQPVEPDERARQHLLEALALDNLAPLAGSTSPGARRRRRFGPHASALTFSTIGVLVLGGVAAAAVTTNTLPGPTRAIAYDLHLPVTSPALYKARQQLHQLDSANAQHHTSVARQLGRGLLHDLTLLNHTDLSRIRVPAKKALTQTGLLPQTLKILGITSPSTTTTVAPSTSTSTSTTTTTTLLPVLPTIPGVGPISQITGSKAVGGVLKNPTSTAKSILP
jgi:hypothetical protein